MKYLITKENRTTANSVDILFDKPTNKNDIVYMTNTDSSNYAVYQMNKINKLIEHNKNRVVNLNNRITEFLNTHPNPSEMYKHYTIPKASGSVRHIDEPEDAQRIEAMICKS